MTKATGRVRKHSPGRKATKTQEKRPGDSERFKKLWADPEWRAKMVAKRRERPRNTSRFGIPDGMRRDEADAAWEVAFRKAERNMEELEEAGLVVPADTKETDEQAARAALQTSLAIMRSPLDAKTRLAAANTVLAYTKSKPATKVEAAVDTAEAWLAAVAKTNDQANQGGDAEDAGASA